MQSWLSFTCRGGHHEAPAAQLPAVAAATAVLAYGAHYHSPAAVTSEELPAGTAAVKSRQASNA